MQNVRTNQRVVLLFPDLLRLWSFAQSLGSRTLEVNTGIKGIYCSVTESDLARALSQYNATLQPSSMDEPWPRWSLS